MAASTEMSDIKLTILYDNYQYDINFNSSWGFSCLIEGLDQTILFDRGGKGSNLMHNIKAAGIDPSIVDMIVLSHDHWDHTGGLTQFLEVRSGNRHRSSQKYGQQGKYIQLGAGRVLHLNQL